MNDTAEAHPSHSIEPHPKWMSRMRSRLKMAAFMFAKLPLGLAAGLRIDEIDGHHCSVSLPFGWRTQNPFRSIYFAAQAMAAEMSTGALGLLAIQSSGESVASLITGMEAEYTKKANRRTTFTCNDGDRLFAAVAETIETGEPVELTAETVGTMPDGTVVAKFRFKWSFKARSAR